MIQTEFEFTLPKGYVDGHGNVHKTGIMRLAYAIDEVIPLQDPRVKMNPAYATIIILSRVIVKLGAVDNISPAVIERLFACDLNYLHGFYRQINEIMEPEQVSSLPLSPNSSLISSPEETQTVSKEILPTKNNQLRS